MRSFFVPLSRISLLASLVFVPVVWANPAPEPARVEFIFSGFSQQKGRVFAQLVCEDRGNKSAPIGLVEPVLGPQVTLKFPDRLAGEVCYVRAFRDTNGNQKLDTNLIGIPSEPYAFSNNAKANLGPPKPESTRFILKPGLNRQAIALN
ncbi:DUF2141 domain-containing protein [Candidatus Phycosocius spiralis]|uniref:DUF2141 domain-containing protein n=1 Tax=Candidatus Phycosocius spiralis TaxID=2815099 RepID=A0ABQ4PWS6_9PROT|nr:DUF2141 domain-containing protein [Candidatus Phycosocius spiralis]GIU67462.1 hypothetical protein PsB1_1616 [Candidatus Phycosocius spiralis]